ncbi:hypothetical protein [uncultured Methanospirillum sp.]|uniref:hypothetical protein n=1 Tax=uncultured Methanospirillum sp. TaxID=262503 RepID=UPI0029C97381|nr:hypothetical protein [uncultured Methanospirillum sp.]
MNLVSTPDANENRDSCSATKVNSFDQNKPVNKINPLYWQHIGEVVNKDCKLSPIYRF